ncbi:MAG: undecaprenyl-diphosphate phosphatase, partial [Rhodospirillales bacterium]
AMTAGRILGMERTDAARFSLLLSIPAISGAGALKGYELCRSGSAALTSDAVLAAALAFTVALIAVALLMAWLRRATFTPFAVYRLFFGGAVLGLVYGWY